MASPPSPDDTRLYLVRVWRRAQGFRASVRAVDDEAPRLFTAPADVAAFLEDAAGQGAGREEPTREAPGADPT